MYEVSMFLMPEKKDWIIPTKIKDEVVLPSKCKRPPGRQKKASEILS